MADGGLRLLIRNNEDEPVPRAAQHIYGESRRQQFAFLIRFIGQ